MAETNGIDDKQQSETTNMDNTENESCAAGDSMPVTKKIKLENDVEEKSVSENQNDEKSVSDEPDDSKENHAPMKNENGEETTQNPDVEDKPDPQTLDTEEKSSEMIVEEKPSSDKPIEESSPFVKPYVEEKPAIFQKPIAPPPSLLTMKELPMPPSLLSLDVADPVCLLQMDQTGKCIDGPGAKRDIKPFAPPRLNSEQKEDISRAKKYAAEQSVKNVIGRQTTQTQANQQMQQFQNDVKRQQALALMCRVYCGSISVNFDVNDDILKKAFAPFGPLKAVKLSFDPLTQNHKGFAFIEYDLPEAAELAIAQMNGYFMGGRNLRVTRPSNVPQAQPMIDQLSAEARAFNRIYITSIHTDLTENDIKSVFGAFGRINKCDLEPDPQRYGKHRGFGFIEFATYQSAMDAVTSMNMFDLGGQLLRVCLAQTPPGCMTITPSPLPQASAVAAAAITAKLSLMENTQPQVQLPPPGLALPATVGAAPPILPTAPVLPATAPAAPAVPQHLANTMSSTAMKMLQMANGPTAAVPHVSIPAINPTASMNQGLAATLHQLGSDAAAASSSAPAASQLSSLPGTNSQSEPDPPAEEDPNHVMVLRNMVGPEDLDDDLEAEVTEECGKFGEVNRVIIYQEKQSEDENAEIIVKIFVEFASSVAMQMGCQSLNNRFFGGRIVTAEKYSQELYESNDLSG